MRADHGKKEVIYATMTAHANDFHALVNIHLNAVEHVFSRKRCRVSLYLNSGFSVLRAFFFVCVHETKKTEDGVNTQREQQQKIYDQIF